MELKLVYGFVPKNGTIDDLIQMKAEELAQNSPRTNQNMKLEDQGIGDDKILKSIQELTAEFKRGGEKIYMGLDLKYAMGKHLWMKKKRMD